MDIHACLPTPDLLTLHATTLRPEVVWLDVESRAAQAACPKCGQVSIRPHSRYIRTLKDLSLLGRRVRWQLTVRKFFCDLESCAQRIFCERLPTVVRPWRRATARLETHRLDIALEVGAQSGARVLQTLGCPVSADALLTTVHRLPAAQPMEVRHLGIDDWAWCKGRRYGTILVDLERQQVIDLLADRDAATVTAWLSAHPEIELITRDRSSAYQEAAALGAPQAGQVADRWHLLKNVRETLERYVTRVHSTIKACYTALQPRTPEQEEPVEPGSALPMPGSAHPPTDRQQHRFGAVKAQLASGRSIWGVARQLGLSTGTVRKYAQIDVHPGTAVHWFRPSPLAPYYDWLTAQWDDGQHNVTWLYHQVYEQGFQGGYTAVREFCRKLRHAPAGTPRVPAPRRLTCPSARTLSWAMLKPHVSLDGGLTALLDHCRAQLSDFSCVEHLLSQGWAMLRRDSQLPLRTWLTALTDSGVKELQAFAVGIDRDFEAIRAALETSHSNGPVEGHVNRLKTLKRGMYGRAGLDLLRARVMYRPV